MQDLTISSILEEQFTEIIEEEENKYHILNYMINKLENKLNLGSLDALKEAIFKKEQTSPNSTALGNKLAIPHGIFFDYSYSREVILSCVFCVNGVKDFISDFDKTKVKFIFLIGYNQESYCTKRTELLKEITTIFSDNKNKQKLEESTTNRELYKNILNILTK